ncbi:rho GTPase-activating protein 190 isoform X5 [Chironomus tepperi]|uniref:rho GTPase-activating protein 190 isoform X5 n=1 Tax=Chironomus tepperi TaxID=113505 RepID=UPI00391F05A6
MKQINVAVVGLSGVEKDKGNSGVGKSCLCNRFVRPLTDDYNIDHISVLSQSDFSGRVVNNDHFLYWGEVRKTSEEGVDYSFQVIEQTEFVDDATFQPFKVGKMEPYFKRCAAIRVNSAEKLMYICKSQLGIEHEYEQIVLPDGRFLIDGYIVVFDVSSVPNRPVEKQADFIINVINNLMKNKKPIVLVTTKNDDANESYVREAEKIIQRKEYKGQVALVETSAHEAINVDLGFIILAQMIDKAKNRSKIVSYMEAARHRKELLDASTEYVTRLIRQQITDHRAIWTTSSKKLAQHKEWQEFIELFGNDAGLRIFRRHLKKLREDYQNKKLQRYLDAFISVLHDIIPDLNSLNIDPNLDWDKIQVYLRNHIDFDQYFFDSTQQNVSWMDLSDFSDMEEENRIPFDVVDTAEAETVFKNHLNKLQQEQKRLEWKKQFKKLLEETNYVTPGKQLSEVRVFFLGRECFEALSEHDCQQIYDNHQREIIETAKHNFQELLLENADLFYHFKTLEPSGTITQNDIKDITDVLQEDFRYKILDRLDQDRKLMLFQHLGFVHCPIREHCPAFPNCIDSLVERIVTSNEILPSRTPHKDGQLQLNLVVIGLDYVANDLISKIHLNCNDNGEYIFDGNTYGLSIETINRDNDSFAYDLQGKGLICCFYNKTTFQYVYDIVDKLLAENTDFKENMSNIHLILLNEIDSSGKIDLSEISETRKEAQQLCEKLHCILLDANDYYTAISPQYQHKFINNVLNSVIEIMPFEDLKYKDVFPSEVPDIRIIMCMFCGDPFSIENVLTSMTNETACMANGERNITFELFLGDQKRRVEVILSSYHGANAFRDELVHGFILLFSTKRKASLATLNAFSINIPNLPMQIVSITDPGGASSFFNNELTQMLITEGNNLADKLRAHFVTAGDEENGFKFASFAPFLKEVWDKKPEIEHAFHMEEPLTIDSGEGTMEHSMHHHQNAPQPPPRYESYLLNGSYRHFDKMSHRSVNSLDGMEESVKYGNVPDERQAYSNMYFYEENNSDADKDDRNRMLGKSFQMYPSPPEPAPPDHHHLLTPSSILRQLKENAAVSHSQSSLEEINSADASGSKESLNTYDSGWIDDHMKDDVWKSMNAHAFTTGRPRISPNTFGKKIPPAVRPKSQTLKQPGKINLIESNAQVPGKLNLASYAIVNEALARMNLGDNNNKPVLDKKFSYTPGSKISKKLKSKSCDATHAAPQGDDMNENVGAGDQDYEEAEYEQINDGFSEAVNNIASQLFSFSSQDHQNSMRNKLRQRREKEQQRLSDSESDSSSLERKRGTEGYKSNRKPQTHKRRQKKRVAIPVATPKIPAGFDPSNNSGMNPAALMYQKLKNEINSSLEKDKMGEEDVSSPRETQSPIVFGVLPKSSKDDREKLLTSQQQAVPQTKSKWFRQDTEKKAQQANEKEEKKRLKAAAKSTGKSGKTLASFKMSDKTPLVPIFLERCVHFIEREVESEGIYRVPGNRAHVELLYQQFDEEDTVDIEKLDIPVNAVATALKDFFSKHLPPLFEPDMMNELEEIAGSRGGLISANPMNMEVKADRSCRLLALRGLLNKLPPANFNILKFIFQHFVHVSEHSKLNSMDSKNLAICWWPTLLPIEFTDMLRFESMRPYLEDIVQTMIDQYPFLFCGQEAFVMV